MRLSEILMLIVILIHFSSVSANDGDEQSPPPQPLDLTVTPDIIHEPEIQKKPEKQQNDRLLPDLFEGQKKEVSVSGALINNEDDSSEVIEGAEISIKVNTK